MWTNFRKLLQRMRFLPRTQCNPDNQENTPSGIKQLCSPNENTTNIVYPPRKSFPSGIRELHSPEDSTFDVVLIHGVTGDRVATWTAPGATQPWPKTLLPRKFPTARVLAFGYDVNAVKWPDVVSENHMAKHARNLHESLLLYREAGGTDERPIIFICHGLGGLVCEEALLVNSGSCLVRSIRGIIFLGTPHSEAGIASWTETVCRSIGLASQKNSDRLRRHSKVLASYQGYFHKVVKWRREARLPPIHIACFYEERPSGEYFVVPKYSAIRPGCASIGICSDHENMTKFAKVDDGAFLAVCEELRVCMHADKGHDANLSPGRFPASNQTCRCNTFGSGTLIVVPHGSYIRADRDQNFLLSNGPAGEEEPPPYFEANTNQ